MSLEVGRDSWRTLAIQFGGDNINVENEALKLIRRCWWGNYTMHDTVFISFVNRLWTRVNCIQIVVKYLMILYVIGWTLCKFCRRNFMWESHCALIGALKKIEREIWWIWGNNFYKYYSTNWIQKLTFVKDIIIFKINCCKTDKQENNSNLGHRNRRYKVY